MSKRNEGFKKTDPACIMAELRVYDLVKTLIEKKQLKVDNPEVFANWMAATAIGSYEGIKNAQYG
jgi:hypothetical protein